MLEIVPVPKQGNENGPGSKSRDSAASPAGNSIMGDPNAVGFGEENHGYLNDDWLFAPATNQADGESGGTSGVDKILKTMTMDPVSPNDSTDATPMTKVGAPSTEPERQSAALTKQAREKAQQGRSISHFEVGGDAAVIDHLGPEQATKYKSEDALGGSPTSPQRDQPPASPKHSSNKQAPKNDGDEANAAVEKQRVRDYGSRTVVSVGGAQSERLDEEALLLESCFEKKTFWLTYTNEQVEDRFRLRLCQRRANLTWLALALFMLGLGQTVVQGHLKNTTWPGYVLIVAALLLGLTGLVSLSVWVGTSKLSERKQLTKIRHYELLCQILMIWPMITFVALHALRARCYENRINDTNNGVEEAYHYCLKSITPYITLFEFCPILFMEARSMHMWPFVIIQPIAYWIGIVFVDTSNEEFKRDIGAQAGTDFCISIWVTFVLYRIAHQQRRSFEYWVLLERKKREAIQFRAEIGKSVKGLLPQSLVNRLSGVELLREGNNKAVVSVCRIFNWTEMCCSVMPQLQLEVMDCICCLFDAKLSAGADPAITKEKVHGDCYVISAGMHNARNLNTGGSNQVELDRSGSPGTSIGSNAAALVIGPASPTSPSQPVNQQQHGGGNEKPNASSNSSFGADSTSNRGGAVSTRSGVIDTSSAPTAPMIERTPLENILAMCKFSKKQQSVARQSSGILTMLSNRAAPKKNPDGTDMSLQEQLACEGGIARQRRELKPQLSIGVHIGPCSAGLIGSQTLGYDLYGDALRGAMLLASHQDRPDCLISDAVFDEAGGINGLLEVEKETVDVAPPPAEDLLSSKDEGGPMVSDLAPIPPTQRPVTVEITLTGPSVGSVGPASISQPSVNTNGAQRGSLTGKLGNSRGCSPSAEGASQDPTGFIDQPELGGLRVLTLRAKRFRKIKATRRGTTTATPATSATTGQLTVDNPLGAAGQQPQENRGTMEEHNSLSELIQEADISVTSDSQMNGSSTDPQEQQADPGLAAGSTASSDLVQVAGGAAPRQDWYRELSRRVSHKINELVPNAGVPLNEEVFCRLLAVSEGENMRKQAQGRRKSSNGDRPFSPTSPSSPSSHTQAARDGERNEKDGKPAAIAIASDEDFPTDLHAKPTGEMYETEFQRFLLDRRHNNSGQVASPFMQAMLVLMVLVVGSVEGAMTIPALILLLLDLLPTAVLSVWLQTHPKQKLPHRFFDIPVAVVWFGLPIVAVALMNRSVFNSTFQYIYLLQMMSAVHHLFRIPWQGGMWVLVYLFVLADVCEIAYADWKLPLHFTIAQINYLVMLFASCYRLSDQEKRRVYQFNAIILANMLRDDAKVGYAWQLGLLHLIVPSKHLVLPIMRKMELGLRKATLVASGEISLGVFRVDCATPPLNSMLALQRANELRPLAAGAENIGGGLVQASECVPDMELVSAAPSQQTSTTGQALSMSYVTTANNTSQDTGGGMGADGQGGAANSMNTFGVFPTTGKPMITGGGSIASTASHTPGLLGAQHQWRNDPTLQLLQMEAIHSVIEDLIDQVDGDLSKPFSCGDEITVAGPLFERRDEGIYATDNSYTRGVAQQAMDIEYEQLCRAAVGLIQVVRGVRGEANAIGCKVSCVLHSGVSFAALVGQMRPGLGFFGPAGRVASSISENLAPCTQVATEAFVRTVREQSFNRQLVAEYFPERETAAAATTTTPSGESGGAPPLAPGRKPTPAEEDLAGITTGVGSYRACIKGAGMVTLIPIQHK